MVSVLAGELEGAGFGARAEVVGIDVEVVETAGSTGEASTTVGTEAGPLVEVSPAVEVVDAADDEVVVDSVDGGAEEVAAPN